MPGVLAWAEKVLAACLLLLLPGSLSERDEPRIWTEYFKSIGFGNQKQLKEFPQWYSGLRIQLVSVVLPVGSSAQCSGLRIWCCHSGGVGCRCVLDSTLAGELPYAVSVARKKKKTPYATHSQQTKRLNSKVNEN